MSSEEPVLKPGHELAEGIRLLVRAPFLSLTLVGVFLAVVGASITDLTNLGSSDDFEYLGFISGILFAIVGLYLQVAITLAAASSGEPQGADPWIRAAIRHRCFWRYIGVSLLAAVLVLLGAVALIVGGIIVGSAVLLCQAAVVLERRRPTEALGRSAELTKPVRGRVAVIFVAVWVVPVGASLLPELLGADTDTIVRLVLGALGTIWGTAGTIAVTRVFVRLGGAPAPPLQTLLYKERTG